jgi:N-acetylglucosaminyl-diphospho-decaprenol L-rhamnosyltransferase
VVVTHNSARHLDALAGTLSAGSLTPVRMLAVDNLSADDTVARARAAGFEVLETGANDGFGAGCNAGLHATSTELVLFCNPDVRPSPTALERLAASLASSPTAAIAGAALADDSRARRFSRISTNVAGFLPERLRVPARHVKGTASAPPSDAEIVVDYVVGAFILCRVAPLLAVGGFDERFFLYCEEEDLCRRLREHGCQTLLVPSAAVAHEQRGSSEGLDGAAMAPFFTHSLYWYYRKHHGRAYAELARCVLAACVLLDRGWRAISRQPQMYGPGAASAPFRTAESLRRASEHA